MTKSMTKPLAVVTGASSGIGLELARQFVENGFDLIIASGSAAIEDAARALSTPTGVVESVRADLSTFEGVETLYARIREAGRPVDCIAVNAGVGVSGDFARETTLEDELNMINLNVTSSVHLTKRVAADMVRNGHGRILITSSIAAVMPAPFMAVYGATKAFLYSFAEALRNELKDTGVTVTALMPGPTDTNFFSRANMQDTKVARQEKGSPALVARQGFDALMAGKDHILAGSMSVKLQGALAELMPEPLKAQRHRMMTEPGSGDSSRH